VYSCTFVDALLSHVEKESDMQLYLFIDFLSLIPRLKAEGGL
jgi:hypothetical protein